MSKPTILIVGDTTSVTGRLKDKISAAAGEAFDVAVVKTPFAVHDQYISKGKTASIAAIVIHDTAGAGVGGSGARSMNSLNLTERLREDASAAKTPVMVLTTRGIGAGLQESTGFKRLKAGKPKVFIHASPEDMPVQEDAIVEALAKSLKFPKPAQPQNAPVNEGAEPVIDPNKREK